MFASMTLLWPEVQGSREMLDGGGIPSKCQHRCSRVHRGDTLDRRTDTAPARFSLQEARFAG